MELTPLKNNKNASDVKENTSATIRLKELLTEMSESLLIGNRFDYNSRNRFSWKNKDKYNPFGYDKTKLKTIKDVYVHYRKNRLRHKLYRIQKEFDFVRNNIKVYQLLTPREKEIIQLLVGGNNNPEIALKLSISRSTVEQHRKHINHKLKIRSFSQLIHFSYAFDLV